MDSFIQCQFRADVKRIGADSFQWYPATGQGTTVTNWNIGHSTWVWEKKLVYFEGDRALKQVAQRGRVVSCSRDTQNPPRHNPVQPAVGKPIGAGRLDQMIFGGPFHTNPSMISRHEGWWWSPCSKDPYGVEIILNLWCCKMTDGEKRGVPLCRPNFSRSVRTDEFRDQGRWMTLPHALFPVSSLL